MKVLRGEKLNRYNYVALKHFSRFIESHKLFTKDDTLLIPVSGGVDSLVMARLVIELQRMFGYSNKISLIHINHATRNENESEQKLVKRFAQDNCLPIKIVKLQEKFSTNFEQRARDFRYKEFEKFNQKGGLVLTGHHLDDSFEWTLMQRMKMTSLENSLGIPIKNKFIRRPLMCFSKEQIYQIATHFKLKYLEDSSNFEDCYERNFIRLHIVANLKRRYPKYLKNYVVQQNDLLKLLRKSENKFHIMHAKNCVVIFFNTTPTQSEIKQVLLKAFYKLSSKKRGVISSQMIKLHRAWEQYKSGPIYFSGGLKVYLDRNMFVVVNESFKPLKLTADKRDKCSREEFFDNLNKNEFPLAVGVELPENIKLSSNRLVESVTSVDSLTKFKHMRIVSVSALLSYWSKTPNRSKMLNLVLFKPLLA